MGEMKKLNYSWALLFSLVKVMFFKDDAATTIIGSKQLLYVLQTNIFRQLLVDLRCKRGFSFPFLRDVE